MVRIYCLTKIVKISPPLEYNDGERVIPYSDEAVERLGDDYITYRPNNILRFLNSRIIPFYKFTEICIGYDYIKGNRKVYVMHFYRDDAKLCVIRMVRGTVSYRQATPNALDLTIATSMLFPNGNTDLLMRIRWIKNSPTGPNIIDKEEERLYREFEKKRKDDRSSDWVETQCESDFEIIKLKIPNSSKSNVLRTKMSRFLTLIKCLCDPSVGSYKNVPGDYVYNQQVKCYLAERSLSMENQNLDEFDARFVMLINVTEVHIFDSAGNLYPSFRNMFLKESNFKRLQNLNLNNCYIQELSDELFELLPEQLSTMVYKKNNIVKISKNISKFKNLKMLNLEDNKNLKDDGIPWESLPSSLVQLNLISTSISSIPAVIDRLETLQTLEISSENLKHIEWSKISCSIYRMIIQGGNQLNEVKLDGKTNLTIFHILNTGLTEIDCTKLPTNIDDFKMSNNAIKIFDAKKSLQIVYGINLINNKLEEIVWENLSESLNYLNIARNYVKIIEDGISHLTELKCITADNNKISRISDKISMLQQLSSLYLQHNKISSLPNGFEMLMNLKKLNLSHNKFHHQRANLLETLWQRLPKNLNVLELSGNNLHTLPCWLKSYKLIGLRVDDCKLVHICPNLYSKDRNLNLNIENNKGIRFLPFIPIQIFHPNDDVLEDSSDVAIIVDSEMLIGKPVSNWEPLYQFKKNEDLILACKCCASCGNETDEEVIEQLMIMDFGLKIQKLRINQAENNDDKENTVYRPDSTIPVLPAPDIYWYCAPPTFFPGKWQTVVRTRLCLQCLKKIKTKIVESQKQNSIKRLKSYEDMNDKISIPLSSHLFLPNINGKNSLLQAVLNLFEAMEYLKHINGYSNNAFQNELANILHRRVNNVENFRKMIPKHVLNKDTAATALKNIIDLLNEEVKELFQFSYEKHEKCKCKVVNIERFSQCYFLSLSIGNLLTSAESFDTLLNRWSKFERKFCFKCLINTRHVAFFDINKMQKYLIVEMNSWIKFDKNKKEQCPISSGFFNVDSQEMLGKTWKLIAAIYSNQSGKYSTWRRYRDHWIVINDEEFRIVDKLLPDFKDYKIFLFEKQENNEERNNDIILSDIDEKVITISKNVTYSTAVFFQTQEPEMTFNPSEGNTMEVDDGYFDPNIIMTENEMGHGLEANLITTSEQYDELRQNYYHEHAHAEIPYVNPQGHSYYHQSTEPQQKFQPTYGEPFQITELNHQNMSLTSDFNYDYSQNYHLATLENANNFERGLLLPLDFSETQHEPMEADLYPVVEESTEFLFQNL